MGDADALDDGDVLELGEGADSVEVVGELVGVVDGDTVGVADGSAESVGTGAGSVDAVGVPGLVDDGDGSLAGVDGVLLEVADRLGSAGVVEGETVGVVDGETVGVADGCSGRELEDGDCSFVG